MSVPSPKINLRQLNILAATIVLANGFSKLVNIPSRGFVLSLGSIQWAVEINGRLLFMVLLALLVILGAESVYRSHPVFQNPSKENPPKSTVTHWILPGLAAFGGSAAVNLLPTGPRWWLGLAFVSFLLVIIVIGEYSVISHEGPWLEYAKVGLNVLGLAILTIILAAISAISARLAFLVPVIGLTVAIISLRLLLLESDWKRKLPFFALGIGILTAEVSLPLSFLPVVPVAFGLILTLTTHTLVGYAQALLRSHLTRSVILEYASLDVLAVISLLWILGR
jgi:hypothetical protein